MTVTSASHDVTQISNIENLTEAKTIPMVKLNNDISKVKTKAVTDKLITDKQKKSINIKEPDVQVIPNQSQRKKVFTVGDSIINGMNYKLLNKNHYVKVHSHGGGTTDDMCHHIQTYVKRKPDLVIIHSGTNDVTNDVDTCKHMENCIRFIKQKLPDTKIALSSISIRKDRKHLDGKIKLLNNGIKKVATDEKVGYICNDNIDIRGLSKGKLHLNKSGLNTLTKNFLTYMETL